MKHGKYGVSQHHTRSGIAHDLLELREYVDVETLGWAKAAYRLLSLLVRADGNVCHDVIKQMRTSATKLYSFVSLSTTINPYHVLDSYLFPVDPVCAVWQDETPHSWGLLTVSDVG